MYARRTTKWGLASFGHGVKTTGGDRHGTYVGEERGDFRCLESILFTIIHSCRQNLQYIKFYPYILF